MKNLANRKQLVRNMSVRHLISALVTGMCFTMTAQAAVENLQINSLVTEAIQTHPLVRSARASQQATTEGINAAKLNFLPTPSVSSGYDRDNDFVSQVTIRQPLWTGGKLTADVNQAIFDDKAAVENIYEQQNQVAKTTIDAWQSYMQAVEKQSVHVENLKALNDFEAMMQRRVAQGVSARIELDLVTNRILQEQTSYQAAAEQQRIAAARLEQIIGQPLSQMSVTSIPNLKMLVEQAKRQSVDFEKMAFDRAGFYNPTVVKEHFQIESAKQSVESQRAAQYPTVYAQYEHAYYHEDSENDGKFSLGLSYAPGAGFSNFALARATQAQVDSLVQNQEAARRNVIENIQVQYQQFVSAKDRERSLVAAVAGAQIVVSSYRRQFIAGRKSWLEVLNAVREHGDYQVQLVQTRAEMLGAFYKLQVDFGIMPWQQFSHNREPVTLFSPIGSVKQWLHEQDSSRIGERFGYGKSAIEDEYIETGLPTTAEQELNNDDNLMLNDDYSIAPIIEQEKVTDN